MVFLEHRPRVYYSITILLYYDRVIAFAQQRISDNQFGFLKQRSTLHQLLSFFSTIIDSFDHNLQVDSVYLDFSKAFDSVPHNELLFKLWTFGITGSLWSWFRSYLSSRHHYVAINSAKSDTLPVLSGVPQGSILGPLLFLIYINDIPLSAPNSSTLLFADDAKRFKVIKDHADRIELQGDLNSLCEWSALWKLLFNDSKCLSVIFAKPNSAEVESSYSLNDKSIAPSKRCKDLGVIVSSDCSWADHYDMILSRAYKILGLLRRSFSSSTSTASKRSLYLSLVRSHLVYCSPLWRPQLKQSIISLERLQKRASKYILNDFTSNYKERLTKIHLLPLMMLFELNDILFLIKCLKKPSKCFDITKYIRFCSSGTRSQTTRTHQIEL